jgi:hypothetical protein
MDETENLESRTAVQFIGIGNSGGHEWSPPRVIRPADQKIQGIRSRRNALWQEEGTVNRQIPSFGQIRLAGDLFSGLMDVVPCQDAAFGREETVLPNQENPHDR